jgi:hypothetical protein
MPDWKKTAPRSKQDRILDEVEQKIIEGRRRVEDTKEQLERSRRLLGETEKHLKK